MLAVTGGKGGCGKTTTALALARAFARSGTDPLVVDADADMPDLHVLAGTAPEPDTDDLAAGARVRDVCHRPAGLSGVRVLPAGRVETVPEALSRLHRWHGPVVVDCPAGASPDATAPLRPSDRTVLVSTDTPQALGDAVKTAAVARQLGAPPLVALVRDRHGTDAEGYFECPVERLPEVRTDEVYAHPRLQAVCQAVRKRVRAEGL